jgi:integrase
MLTERKITTAAPPPGKREKTLHDEPGLMLRVRRNKGGSVTRVWTFCRQTGGQRRRIALGAWPTIDLTEARRRAEHHRKLADSGVRVTSALTPSALSANPETVGDLFTTWLTLYAAPRHRDKGARVRWLLDKHAAPIAPVLLRDLQKQHITLAVLPLVAKGHHKTAADLFTLLRQITAFGARHDFLSTDPAASLRRSDVVPPRNGPRERVLSEAELRALGAAFNATRTVGPRGREFDVPALSPVARAAVWALLATAARPGELARAAWKDVDLKARTWHIPAATSKTGNPHIVFLSPFAVEAFSVLKELAAGAPRVLPVSRAVLGRQLKDRQRPETKRNQKRAHNSELVLPDGPWSLHDLRRTAATMMGNEGVAYNVIERCLNHSPPKLVRTYQRADLQDEQRAAFKTLGTRLKKLVPQALPTLRRELKL